MNRFLLTLAFGAAGSALLPAASLDFTYDTFNGIRQKYGSGKAETINVAIFLGPELAGRNVMGLKVPVYAQEGKVSNPTGWTSTALASETDSDNLGQNVIDGTSATGTIDGEHILSVTFPEPVAIPAEGLYVGYSYQALTKLAGKSVAAVDGNRKGECFYLASRSKKRWGDLYEMKRLASAMTVTLEGDFPQNGAAISFDAPTCLGLDSGSASVTLVNTGTLPLSRIGYSYSADDGTKGEGTLTLSSPIEGVYGRGTRVDLPLPGFNSTGDRTLSVKVTSINGVPAESPENMETPLSVMPFVPVFHPIVEEYTYLGCGWCPRGYVMLEQMKARYGDRFVAISYHSTNNEGRAMNTIPDSEKPLTSINGYPAASLHRGDQINPGDVSAGWKQMLANTTNCDVKGEIEAGPDSTFTVTAKSRFTKSFDKHSYRIAFVIVADGLHSTKWRQANYYDSYTAEGMYKEPFWNLFVGQDHSLTDLEYNDIAMAMTDYHGIEDSLPATLEAGKEYTFSHTFDAQAYKNLNGQTIVGDTNKVRVIAFIVDGNTGRVANCSSSLYADGGNPFPVRDDLDWGPFIEPDNEEVGAVQGIHADLQVVAVRYLDINGFEVANPLPRQILIKEETLENGRKVYSKIIK